MNTLYKLLAAATAALITINTAPAGAQSRGALKKENKLLRERIDSLENRLREIEEAEHAKDSIAGEIIQIFEENNDRSGAYSPDEVDSLLNLWYLHRQIGNVESLIATDSVKFTSKTPDSVIIRRLESINSFITLPYNETVRSYIIMYAEKMPERLSHMLSLAEYYFPIFEETLNAYDMPLELKYMAVIESALNPVAVSRARAKGMWQFIYSTAKIYGLKINTYVDERFDPVKAADAAARYLKDAYDVFGDWNLAISSYNCGLGNVNKAIRRAGGKKDFWAIYRYLPRETRGYVPAFVGAMYAFNFYREHGVTPAASPMPPSVDTFYINKNLHFRQITDVVGIPGEDLHNLNPQYLKEVIPGREEPSILRIPTKYTAAFVDMEDSLYRYKAEEFFSPSTLTNIHNGLNNIPERIVYRVKKGDYLGKIATKHHVTVSQIKQWNGLRNNNLRIGQKLVIYSGGESASVSTRRSGGKTSPGKKVSSKTNSSSTQGASVSEGYTIYVVRRGDSLSKIASRYPGVSIRDIRNANNLTGNKIRAGQKLRIPKK